MKDVVKATPSAFDTVFEALKTEALPAAERGESSEWLKDKLAATVTASSVEEINAAADTGLTASKLLVGRSFIIESFELSEASAEYRDNSMLKKWAVVRAYDKDTGEEIIISGGGDTFVAQLVAMRRNFGFPFSGTLLSKTTASGNDMLYWRMHQPKADA